VCARSRPSWGSAAAQRTGFWPGITPEFPSSLGRVRRSILQQQHSALILPGKNVTELRVPQCLWDAQDALRPDRECAYRVVRRAEGADDWRCPACERMPRVTRRCGDGHVERLALKVCERFSPGDTQTTPSYPARHPLGSTLWDAPLIAPGSLTPSAADPGERGPRSHRKSAHRTVLRFGFQPDRAALLFAAAIHRSRKAMVSNSGGRPLGFATKDAQYLAQAVLNARRRARIRSITIAGVSAPNGARLGVLARPFEPAFRRPVTLRASDVL